MKPSKRNNTYPDAGDYGPNFGFMLYYNLYRIASIQHWGDSVNSIYDNSCPCHIDSFLLNRTLRVNAIEPEYFYNQGNHYFLFRNSYSQQDALVKTTDLNPAHVKYGIRNPEYINHYYRVNNNQVLEVIRDLVICGNSLDLK